MIVEEPKALIDCSHQLRQHADNIAPVESKKLTVQPIASVKQRTLKRESSHVSVASSTASAQDTALPLPPPLPTDVGAAARLAADILANPVAVPQQHKLRAQKRAAAAAKSVAGKLAAAKKKMKASAPLQDSANSEPNPAPPAPLPSDLPEAFKTSPHAAALAELPRGAWPSDRVTGQHSYTLQPLQGGQGRITVMPVP